MNDLVLECADVHKTALSAIDKLTEDVPKAEQLTGAAWAATKLKGHLVKSVNVCFGFSEDKGRCKYMEDRMVALEMYLDSLPHNESVQPTEAASKSAGASAGTVLKKGSVNAFFGVYDGHGGAHVSHLLSKRLHRYVLNAQHIHSSFRKTLEEGFLAMDRECQKLCDDEGLLCGSTAIVVCIAGKKFYCGNAGDCRGVLLRGDKAIALSRDHKPNCKEERERIEKAGGTVQEVKGIWRVDGLGLSVSRAFGDIEYKKHRHKKFSADLITAKPDVTDWDIQPEDKFIILACDGLWDIIESQAACNLVWRSLADKHDADLAAQELVSSAIRLGSDDNVSAIVICFHQK